MYELTHTHRKRDKVVWGALNDYIYRTIANAKRQEEWKNGQPAIQILSKYTTHNYSERIKGTEGRPHCG